MNIKQGYIEWVLTGILIVLAAFGVYQFRQVLLELAVVKAESQLVIKGLETNLAQARDENIVLASSLKAERERNDSFAGQIDDIAGTVGVLEKIKNTDPELLKKYSKVYFLNENYIPAKLGSIAKQYLYDSKKPELFQGDLLDHLEDMLAAAAKDSVDLRVVSAFRSFDTQASLKNAYLTSYGSGANKFSADQGYSEHQLGTAVDLAFDSTSALELSFEQTAAYKWLGDNAYRYGFTLSYPKGNTYYQFEPWHWRFVGLRLAKYLHNEDKNFYDLEQREIDEYRAKFFD